MGNTISENKAAFTAVTAAALSGITYLYFCCNIGLINLTKSSRKTSLNQCQLQSLQRRQPKAQRSRYRNLRARLMSLILHFKTSKSCLLCCPTMAETKLWNSPIASNLKEEKDSPKNADSAISETTSDSQPKVL